ncbi:MAG TPA: DUF4845 domain-containing protein [Burkholderiales bacterium]|jgi:hypothetical protein|nr:DUF4845 domain-containing protein [Burkholderiales bacterium]
MIMYKQAGLSMSGFLMWCVIFAFGALLGFKLAPAYMEDLTIKKHLHTIASDPAYSSGNRKEIENAFSNRQQIDRIEVISPKDIVVSKEGGGIVLSASYTTRIPLLYNINACLDFNPTSK